MQVAYVGVLFGGQSMLPTRTGALVMLREVEAEDLDAARGSAGHELGDDHRGLAGELP